MHGCQFSGFVISFLLMHCMIGNMVLSFAWINSSMVNESSWLLISSIQWVDDSTSPTVFHPGGVSTRLGDIADGDIEDCVDGDISVGSPIIAFCKAVLVAPWISCWGCPAILAILRFGVWFDDDLTPVETHLDTSAICLKKVVLVICVIKDSLVVPSSIMPPFKPEKPHVDLPL